MQDNKIKLYGFNNLTKTLSFNMYDICYTKSVKDRIAYIEYIDEQYNAAALTEKLKDVTRIIGANIISLSMQDYDPQGASGMILISDDGYVDGMECVTPQTLTSGSGAGSVAAHLDKSHITVHTYPEYHPDGGVCTFRADIDVSTCGEISPLNALNYLIKAFEADIMTIDYKVRGFTRDITGRKLFIDHPLTSIQNYVEEEIRNKYQFIDVNVYQENVFHTKCKLREFDLDNYFFHFSKDEISAEETYEITSKLKREMDEIFYGRNMAFNG